MFSTLKLNSATYRYSVYHHVHVEIGLDRLMSLHKWGIIPWFIFNLPLNGCPQISCVELILRICQQVVAVNCVEYGNIVTVYTLLVLDILFESIYDISLLTMMYIMLYMMLYTFCIFCLYLVYTCYMFCYISCYKLFLFMFCIILW